MYISKNVVLYNRGGEKDENARFNGTKRNYSEHSKNANAYGRQDFSENDVFSRSGT